MSKPARADEAYAAIEQLIVATDLAPGSLVSESLLMQKTGFGRTPVREALQRLARDGMVNIHPNKGVLIPAMSVEAQLRLLEMRRVLEVLAVQLACERAQTEDLAEMRNLVERLIRNEFTLANYAETVTETHHLIVRAADNNFLTGAMAPLQGLSRRFWIGHVRDEGHEISTGAKLHQRILEAILANDCTAGAAASRELNDYLVDFAYRSVGARPRVTRQQEH